MQIVKCFEDIEKLTENRIIGGEHITFKNSEIRFTGKNNLLFCEEGVTLSSSQLKFNGDHCLIYLSQNKHAYMLDVTLYRDSVLYFGKNNYFNGAAHIILSERRHGFFGRDNLFSFGVWVRTADPHLIYSAKTMERINPSKSVFVGDHVWLGQGAMLLKGTQVASGSIIGAMALVAGKRTGSCESWGGNPAKCIAKDVFWDPACVHAYDEEKTAASESYQSKKHIFTYHAGEALPFETVEKALSGANPREKLAYLQSLPEEKNRFSCKESAEPTTKKRKLFR